MNFFVSFQNLFLSLDIFGLRPCLLISNEKRIKTKIGSIFSIFYYCACAVIFSTFYFLSIFFERSQVYIETSSTSDNLFPNETLIFDFKKYHFSLTNLFTTTENLENNFKLYGVLGKFGKNQMPKILENFELVKCTQQHYE